MNAKQERKQGSHARILASAAALLRSRGIRASSVAAVMKAAGLTVGGFYGHFGSKEELFVATLHETAQGLRARLFDQRSASRGAEERASPSAPLARIVERYTSRKHRDDVEGGCPLPAVVAEVAREGEPYRGALAEELEALVDDMANVAPGARAPKRRELALGMMALMYGALSLSRALRGTALADDVLHAARSLAAAAVSNDEGA